MTELLDGGVGAASLGAALELGLFWLLESGELTAPDIAGRLRIPPVRCAYWLEIIRRGGLLERVGDAYHPSAAARHGILESFSQATWALLAVEARERRDALTDLPRRLRTTGRSRRGAAYVLRMATDPERARRFTRMLFELHQPLAGRMTDILDLTGVDSLLDLGGGSGVISIGLARRWPGIRFTVLDIGTVCAEGRAIAAECGLADRIGYLPADFLHDDLPAGYDVVLECDVGVYRVPLFRRVRAALPPWGRYLIADQLACDGSKPPAHLTWAFSNALRDPRYAHATAAGVIEMLRRAGFGSVESRAVPAGGREAGDSMFLIDARG